MKLWPGFYLIVVALAFLAVMATPVAGATTEVRIVLYADDGYTILNETTADYRWMEANLPVLGDGVTHYYHQGPVFVDDPDEDTEQALRWNPEEDTNVEVKGMGALKGTNVKDLCELVGGMNPDEEVRIVSSDGWNRKFAYENVYEYSNREGPMVLTWYNAADTPGTWEPQGVGYVPDYYSGMRLVWFADTSVNPQGLHAFGVWDWHEAADPDYWYYYYGSPTEKYPTTTGLSGKYISEIQILSNQEPVGSIEVTSEPAGARVYIDETDSGLDTPCTLEDLSEGYYTLTVRKNGYFTPEEQNIEVVAGKIIPVEFNLEPVPQGGGSSGSEDSGDGVLYQESNPEPLSGGQLSGTDNLEVKGSIILLPAETASFVLKGGEDHSLAFDTPSNRSPVLLRLYVFLDESSGDSGTDLKPQVFVAANTGWIKPIRTWSDQGDDERPYATTLVYNLSEWNENGTYTIHSENSRSWNSTVSGALLVAGYEEPGGMLMKAWIREGADIIGEIPGQEMPITLAEFIGGYPSSELVNITLLTAATPSSAAGNLSFFVNGVSMPYELVSGTGSVTVCKIPMSDLSEIAGIRLYIGTTGPEITNRLGIITFAIPWQAGEVSSIPQTSVITNQTTVPISNVTTGAETIDEEFVPAGGQGESPNDRFGNFLCWLLNIILTLSGQPPEPCYQSVDHVLNSNDSLPSAQETEPQPALVTIHVSSSPEGASVFLDGQPIGITTPCQIKLVQGEVRSLRIEKDGYQPFEEQITGMEAVEVLLLPELPAQEDSAIPEGTTSKSHHGGVYIHSYPANVEISVDGVVVGTSSPVLVSPLKEGFHTIAAGILVGENAYSVKESVRTWIFPDAVVPVEFNLMDPPVSSFVDISSESRSGDQFTVNGYYPVKRIPVRVEFTENPLFITLTNGSSYLSFAIPESGRESRAYSLPWSDPPVSNLSVDSYPEGAEIFIDGIRSGFRTPSVIPNVSAGYHRVSIVQYNRIPVTELINIPESQFLQGEYKVHYETDWYPSGSLTFTSDPPGAAVSIRGLKTGEVTPCTLEGIPLGIWEATLSLNKTTIGVDTKVEPDSNRTYSVVFD